MITLQLLRTPKPRRLSISCSNLSLFSMVILQNPALFGSSSLYIIISSYQLFAQNGIVLSFVWIHRIYHINLEVKCNRPSSDFEMCSCWPANLITCEGRNLNRMCLKFTASSDFAIALVCLSMELAALSCIYNSAARQSLNGN